MQAKPLDIATAAAASSDNTVGSNATMVALVLCALWVPSLLWLWMQLQAKVALPMTLLLAYAFYTVHASARGDGLAPRRSWRLQLASIVTIVVFSMCWTAFTGLPHVMKLNADWMTRLESLNQFLEPSWQVLHDSGQDYMFRFPGAYYAIAALFKSSASIEALRVVLYCTTGLTCALALIMLFGKTTGRALFVFLFVMVCMNGLDFLGVALPALLKGAPLPPFGSHVEWWAGVQYSGITTAMIWVPNHLLPTLLFCSLLPLSRSEGEQPSMARLHLLVLAAAGTMLWSPLVFLGTLPILLAEFIAVLHKAAWRLDWRALNPAYVGAILLVMLVISWYLTLGAGVIRKGFYFQSCGLDVLKCGGWLVFFYIAEAFPLAWLCSRLPNRSVGFSAAVTLLVLPLLVYGASNDLTMRASLPGIVVAAMSLNHLLETQKAGVSKGLLWLFIVVAGYSAASELWRGVSDFKQDDWQTKGFMRAFQESFPETIVDGYPAHYMIPIKKACAGIGKEAFRACASPN